MLQVCLNDILKQPIFFIALGEVKIKRWPRSTMDSIRASEAPDPGSIPGEATKQKTFTINVFCGFKNYFIILFHSNGIVTLVILPSAFTPSKTTNNFLLISLLKN